MRNKLLSISFKNFSKLFKSDDKVYSLLPDNSEHIVGKFQVSKYGIYTEDSRIHILFEFIKSLKGATSIPFLYPPEKDKETIISLVFIFEEHRYDYSIMYNNSSILEEKLYIDLELAAIHDNNGIRIDSGWVRYSNYNDDKLLIDCYYDDRSNYITYPILINSGTTISNNLSKFIEDYLIIYDNIVYDDKKDDYYKYLSSYDKSVLDIFRDITPKLFPDSLLKEITENLDIRLSNGELISLNNNFNFGSGLSHFLIFGPILVDSMINNKVILANCYFSEYHPVLFKTMEKLYASYGNGQLIYID